MPRRARYSRDRGRREAWTNAAADRGPRPVDVPTPQPSEIGGQLGFDHKTADRYIAILEQLFLVRRLRPWFRNELKRLVKTPKLHVMDTGLLAAMRGLTLDRLRVNRGALGPVLESYVHAELVRKHPGPMSA